MARSQAVSASVSLPSSLKFGLKCFIVVLLSFRFDPRLNPGLVFRRLAQRYRRKFH